MALAHIQKADLRAIYETVSKRSIISGPDFTPSQSNAVMENLIILLEEHGFLDMKIKTWYESCEKGPRIRNMTATAGDDIFVDMQYINGVRTESAYRRDLAGKVSAGLHFPAKSTVDEFEYGELKNILKKEWQKTSFYGIRL